MRRNSHWIGLIAGKIAEHARHADDRIRSGISPPDLNYLSLWERTHYVECVGADRIAPRRELLSARFPHERAELVPGSSFGSKVPS